MNLPGSPLEARNLRAGRFVSASGVRTADVLSPYTDTVIGHVPLSTPGCVTPVIDAAHDAFEAWRARTLKERSEPLFRFRSLLLQHLERLAHLVAAESGKTVAEARAGVLKGVEVAEFALSLQNLDAGGSQQVSQGVRCELRREPLGVVAGITPFNFPAMVPLWLFPIAVTLGNTFVLKPSDKVPLTADVLGELMVEAGYPPGVFSLVHGGREAVEALIDDTRVRAVGFVGSSAIARQVYERAAAQGKRALALGGAKNHMIVTPDADPRVTTDGVVASFTGCAGQRCMAGSVLLAVGDCDALIDGVVQAAGQVRLGHDMGAIIDRAALERLHSAIERGLSEGATLRLDGRDPTPPAGYEGGYWLSPSVLDDVAEGSFCASEELFGPVLSVVRCDTLQDALRLENASRYGNATSVFTTRGDVARRVSEAASSGMVGINVGVPVPREPFSFGGTKASRFGYGDITGEQGVAFWSQLKKVTSKWEPQDTDNWMG